MSNKVERPTLQGQRIKTRKRDEKEKFDPGAFRDQLLIGINDSCPVKAANQISLQPLVDGQRGGDSSEVNKLGSKSASPATSQASSPATQKKALAEANNGNRTQKDRFDAVSKFLDVAGSKLDYRRYGEVIFDILIAGGILAPGGTVSIDPDPNKISTTDFCLFNTPLEDKETIDGFAQVIVKLIRRYKYLEKQLDEEFKKIVAFLKGFTPDDRIKLARLTGLLISGGHVAPTVLLKAIQDHLVKDGIAVLFLVDVFRTWVAEKDAQTVWSSVKKAGLDGKIMEFLPSNKRTTEHFGITMNEAGLGQLLELQKAGLSNNNKRELQAQVANLMKDEASSKEIIAYVKDTMIKNSLTEHEVISLLWTTLMQSTEWNKKEELVAEQALKHLKGYTGLLAAFTQNAKSEFVLISKVQDFCYENMNFLKVFQKIILLFYKADVLSEDTILKWYKDAGGKGKSVFLDQMKKFVEWLQNAEEESETEN